MDEETRQYLDEAKRNFSDLPTILEALRRYEQEIGEKLERAKAISQSRSYGFWWELNSALAEILQEIVDADATIPRDRGDEDVG